MWRDMRTADAVWQVPLRLWESGMETNTNAGAPASTPGIWRSFAILKPEINPRGSKIQYRMIPGVAGASNAGAAIVSRRELFLLGWVTAGDDPQIIRHLKSSWYLISADAGKVLVPFTVYHALQCDASIPHNDMDGRNTHVAVLK